MGRQRLSIFPLAGAMLFPGLHLPLHIFEPRYRALVRDAMARDRLIGMIQPRDNLPVPTLFDMGCVGKIADVQALDDGRFNIVLEGQARFRVVRELDVSTPFRQVEAELDDAEADPDDVLAAVTRAALDQSAKRFALSQGYIVDWDEVARLDDESLVNGMAQIAPFDPASKQALFEAENLAERAELLMQMMQFFGKSDGRGGEQTLQ